MDGIVNLLWKCDEAALKKWKACIPFCHNIIMRFIGNLQDAEEILNDIRLQIRGAIQPAKPRYFKTYLAKNTRDTALHYIERESAPKHSRIIVFIDELSECFPVKNSCIVSESYHI